MRGIFSFINFGFERVRFNSDIGNIFECVRG